MTDEQPVRLVVLGDAAGAPVCEGDVCDVPLRDGEAPPPEAEAADHPQ